uniref:Uncharacterized protein n=1 Tax=Odontella aurita TaxID=265563 RepID=A0A7S4KCG0_9STRA
MGRSNFGRFGAGTTDIKPNVNMGGTGVGGSSRGGAAMGPGGLKSCLKSSNNQSFDEFHRMQAARLQQRMERWKVLVKEREILRMQHRQLQDRRVRNLAAAADEEKLNLRRAVLEQQQLRQREEVEERSLAIAAQAKKKSAPQSVPAAAKLSMSALATMGAGGTSEKRLFASVSAAKGSLKAKAQAQTQPQPQPQLQPQPQTPPQLQQKSAADEHQRTMLTQIAERDREHKASMATSAEKAAEAWAREVLRKRTLEREMKQKASSSGRTTTRVAVERGMEPKKKRKAEVVAEAVEAEEKVEKEAKRARTPEVPAKEERSFPIVKLAPDKSKWPFVSKAPTMANVMQSKTCLAGPGKIMSRKELREKIEQYIAKKIELSETSANRDGDGSSANLSATKSAAASALLARWVESRLKRACPNLPHRYMDDPVSIESKILRLLTGLGYRLRRRRTRAEDARMHARAEKKRRDVLREAIGEKTLRSVEEVIDDLRTIGRVGTAWSKCDTIRNYEEIKAREAMPASLGAVHFGVRLVRAYDSLLRELVAAEAAKMRGAASGSGCAGAGSRGTAPAVDRDLWFEMLKTAKGAVRSYRRLEMRLLKEEVEEAQAMALHGSRSARDACGHGDSASKLVYWQPGKKSVSSPPSKIGQEGERTHSQ